MTNTPGTDATLKTQTFTNSGALIMQKERRLRCIEQAVVLITHDYTARDSEASVQDAANMIKSVANDFFLYVENG